MAVDTNSSTWRAVKKHAETEIAAALGRLETPGLPLTETEHERGQIKALRGLLDLAKPPVAIPSSEPHYGD